jgi:hypothetical protein
LVPTLEPAIKEYLANLAHLAESIRYTIGVHLRNFQRKLADKVGRSLADLARSDLGSANFLLDSPQRPRGGVRMQPP